MGFFQKLKDFGSKIIRGVQKGAAWIRDKAAPVVKKVWQFAKPAINALVPGGPAITDTAERIGGNIYRLVGGKD